MSFSIRLESVEQLKKSKGLGVEGKIQQYIDAEVLRRMAPLTPLDTGALQSSAHAKGGEVVYAVPYARYLYYGKAMVGASTGSSWALREEEKIISGRQLHFQGAPLRGAFWFLRMKAQYGQEILKGAGRCVGR